MSIHPYLVIGHPHKGIGHSTTEIPCVTHEDAMLEVDNLLANSSIIHHVIVLENGKVISKHY